MPASTADRRLIEKTARYSAGFSSNIDTEAFPPGLSPDIIRAISKKKKEPRWLLDYRLKAYAAWKKMTMPQWPIFTVPRINFNALSYFAAPRKKPKLKDLSDADPELLKTFEKLGIPLQEQKRLAGVAVDAVLDSVSVATTFQDELKKAGVIFCSFSEGVQKYPKLIKKYLGTVVPAKDNFFAALNAAVFSDGTFVYIPKGVKCPMELSTYFRINAENTGQFERTLIVADKNAQVSYLEGCTAPARDEHQLHAAVVEVIAEEKANVRYSTVQNWYPGDSRGRGGVYNFVTKRAIAKGKKSKVSWTQVETGSRYTWKYPSCILAGDESTGLFYSVAITRGHQAADTGTKMIHIGKKTRSHIVSKSVSLPGSTACYRGQVVMSAGAEHAHSAASCDSLLIGSNAAAVTLPDIDSRCSSASVAHEASTTKLNPEQLAYAASRGLTEEVACGIIVSGFTREVLQHLPMEFATEAKALLQLSMEGSVG